MTVSARTRVAVPDCQPGGAGLRAGIAVASEPGRRETIFVVDVYTLRGFGARSGKEQNVTRWAPGLSPALPVTVAWDDGNLVLAGAAASSKCGIPKLRR